MTQENLKTGDEILAYPKILIGPLIVAGIKKNYV